MSNLKWLDDIEAQMNETTPYYVPRMIQVIRECDRTLEELRVGLTDLSKHIAKIGEVKSDIQTVRQELQEAKDELRLKLDNHGQLRILEKVVNSTEESIPGIASTSLTNELHDDDRD